MYILCTRVEDNLFDNDNFLFFCFCGTDKNIMGFIAERSYHISTLASQLKCKSETFLGKGTNHDHRAYVTHMHLYIADGEDLNLMRGELSALDFETKTKLSFWDMLLSCMNMVM